MLMQTAYNNRVLWDTSKHNAPLGQCIPAHLQLLEYVSASMPVPSAERLRMVKSYAVLNVSFSK